MMMMLLVGPARLLMRRGSALGKRALTPDDGKVTAPAEEGFEKKRNRARELPQKQVLLDWLHSDSFRAKR
jgi:hypothetical protein